MIMQITLLENTSLARWHIVLMVSDMCYERRWLDRMFLFRISSVL